MDNFSIENIYYLGPKGSNVNLAMLKFIELCNINYQNIIPVKSIKGVLEAHKKDKSSICVLPIENSIEGIVRETIDNLLNFEDTKILAQVSLPINHILMGVTKDKKNIKKIISHPQALAQCSKYLYKNFPDAELKEFSSTSYAAEKVRSENDETTAAIANEICAKLFNLNILDRNLNDEKDNKTRFYLLGRNNITIDNNPKTAVIFSIKNKAGSLCEVLKVFSSHNINMTYIDSRPSKKKLGEYIFFIEFEGSQYDNTINKAIKELKTHVDFIKVLGSFEVFE